MVQNISPDKCANEQMCKWVNVKLGKCADGRLEYVEINIKLINLRLV